MPAQVVTLEIDGHDVSARDDQMHHRRRARKRHPHSEALLRLRVFPLTAAAGCAWWRWKGVQTAGRLHHQGCRGHARPHRRPAPATNTGA